MPASQIVSLSPAKRSRSESPADVDGEELHAKRHARSSISGTPRRSPSADTVAAIAPIARTSLDKRSRSGYPDEAELHAGSFISETSGRSLVATLIPISLAKRSRSESPDYSDAEPPAKRHAASSSSGDPCRSPSPDAVAAYAPTTAPLTVMSMPPEILDYIFELLLPPAGVLCPTSDSDSEKLNPFWQRSMLAKRAIVSVCRAWYNVGLPFLYRHIALANTGQIAALYRTLATHPELGERVRCITFMSSLDVELFCEETAHEDMTRIFELCPQLTRVNDLPPPPAEQPWGYEHPHPYPAIPSTVTALRLGQHRSLSYICATLRKSCERLEELWLDTDHNPALDTLALAFPRLHTLHLTCGSARTKALARWDMPRLRRLTFLFADDTRAARGTYKEYKRILALHGRNLEYLAFPDRYPLTSRPPDLGPLLALCPTVRHLVAPVGYSLSRHVHPSVQRLDLWYGVLPDDEKPLSSEVLHNEFRAASAKKDFPSLVGTRTLQRALLPFFTDLARAVGPHARGDWRWALAPGLAVTQEDRGDISHVV